MIMYNLCKLVESGKKYSPIYCFTLKEKKIASGKWRVIWSVEGKQDRKSKQRDQGGIIPYPELTVDGKCFLDLKLIPQIWYVAEEIKAMAKG